MEQGLIGHVKIGGHWEYRALLDELANKLDSIEHRIRPEESASETTKNMHEATYADINDENIVKECSSNWVMVAQELFETHAGERVRVLLSRDGGGAEGSVARFVQYMHMAFGVQSCARLEVLLCTNIAELLRSKKAFLQLPSDPDRARLNIVPASYCSRSADMLMFRDRVAVLNERKGSMNIVTSVQVVEAMKHLLDIASETGWSVSTEAWLE